MKYFRFLSAIIVAPITVPIMAVFFLAVVIGTGIETTLKFIDRFLE